MTELQHLPPLTPDQANAVAAYLTAEGSLVDASSFMGFSLAEFLDLLAAPNVQTHLDHACKIARRRAEQRAADAAYEAVNTLEEISKNTNADPTERRRAATTLLRAFAPASAPRRRPRVDVNHLANLVARLDADQSRADVDRAGDQTPAAPRTEGAGNQSPPAPTQATSRRWCEAKDTPAPRPRRA